MIPHDPNELTWRIYKIAKILKGADTLYIIKNRNGKDYFFKYPQETLIFLKKRLSELIEESNQKEANNEK